MYMYNANTIEGYCFPSMTGKASVSSADGVSFLFSSSSSDGDGATLFTHSVCCLFGTFGAIQKSHLKR